MQHAKRVVGRRVMSGGTNYLPLKVNTAGVIPVIFASAILSFPSFIASYFAGGDQTGGWLGRLFALRSETNLYTLFERWFGLSYEGAFLLLKSFNFYVIMFGAMTGFFCYFYTAVAFNPDDVANNLKKSGSFIPGKRPGKPTSEYIDYVLTRVTTLGAAFLVLIAVIPLVLEVSFNMPPAATSFVGGTGLIIVVGVLLDTLRQVESQLLMRHYEGFAMRRASAARWR
jgi:preprotein translocase subunit SecY